MGDDRNARIRPSSTGDQTNVAPVKPSARPLGAADIFLASLASIALLVVVAFLATSRGCASVAPIGVALFTALAVSILVYAFLGGADAQVMLPYIRVSGSAAVFIAIVLIVQAPLERQMTGSCLRILFKGSAAPVPGGGTVRLVEVKALRNDPSTLRNFPNGEQVMVSLLRNAGIYRNPTEFFAMSQPQWKQVLSRLPPDKSNQLADRSFAQLQLTASNDDVRDRTVLTDEVPIQREDGTVEAHICVRHILNVRDESGEPEVVLFTNGRC